MSFLSEVASLTSDCPGLEAVGCLAVVGRSWHPTHQPSQVQGVRWKVVKEGEDTCKRRWSTVVHHCSRSGTSCWRKSSTRELWFRSNTLFVIMCITFYDGFSIICEAIQLEVAHLMISTCYCSTVHSIERLPCFACSFSTRHNICL